MSLKSRLLPLTVICVLLISYFPEIPVFGANIISTDIIWDTDQTPPQDVVISTGEHLIVMPGVTVTFPCSDPNTEGRDPDRVEILVETGGQLTVDGAIFKGETGAGCWAGIFIESGDSLSVIENATIQDAVLGIKIVDSSPDILNNEIMNMKGEDGVAPGESGDPVYGIHISVASGIATPAIQGNIIRNMAGGSGSNGQDGLDGASPGGNGANGAAGGAGGEVIGIYIGADSNPDIIGNQIFALTGGACGHGGTGGDGADGAAGMAGGSGGNGGNGGKPGDVFGIRAESHLDTYFVGNTIRSLSQNSTCHGGDGGAGGVGVAGASGLDDQHGEAGGAGGRGGNGGRGMPLASQSFVYGIYVSYPWDESDTHDLIKSNIIYDLYGSNGNSGGNGGSGGAGGNGGKGGAFQAAAAANGGAGGIGGAGGSGGPGSIGVRTSAINIVRISLTVEANKAFNIFPGDGGNPGTAGTGGAGGSGGAGGDHAGGTAGSGGDGGTGGSGGSGGSGGRGGSGAGIFVDSYSTLNYTFVNNDVYNVEGGAAADAQSGGSGGAGGSGGDMGLGTNGAGGSGGNGGNGGNGGSGGGGGSVHLLEVDGGSGVVINNTFVDAIAPVDGGIGGEGGTGGPGGSDGNGDIPGVPGVNGTVGGDGMSGSGGQAVGIEHSSRAENFSISNNIVVCTDTADNTIGITESEPGEIDYVDYNNVFGWRTAFRLGDTAGSNNQTTNPQFVSATDHRLWSLSPCIDAGDNAAAPAQDLNGDPRPIDSDGDGTAIVDLGAYEAELSFVLLFPLVIR
jgi:hypothetical protein